MSVTWENYCEPTREERKRILHSTTVLGESTFVAIKRSAVKRYTDVRIADVTLRLEMECHYHSEGLLLVARER